MDYTNISYSSEIHAILYWKFMDFFFFQLWMKICELNWILMDCDGLPQLFMLILQYLLDFSGLLSNFVEIWQYMMDFAGLCFPFLPNQKIHKMPPISIAIHRNP